MGVARKLQSINQDLTLLAGQGKAVGFLTNTENAQKINGLVEDIHEAMIDYQVCRSSCLHALYLSFLPRLHCNKIFTTKVACSL